FETSTDAGAHASAGPAAKTDPLPAMPAAAGQSMVEEKLRREQSARPKSFDTNLALGQFLLETGRPADAVSFLLSARSLNPKNVPARHDLSVAYLEIGKLDEAQALLTELQKEASSAAVVHLEARWLAASGKPIPAAERFREAAEAEPTETHLFDWGNHMLAHGAAEPAGKIFSYALKMFPKSARLKVAQGVAHYAQGEFDQAVRSLCEGVDLDPQDLRPLVFLGQMIDVSPNLNQEVRRRLEGFARLYPSHAQAQYFYGMSLLKQDDGKAEQYLRRAATLEPRMPEPHLELGKLYADAGRTDEAIQELESAIELSSNLDTAHYKLALLYQRAGKAELAEEHFTAYRKIRAEKAEREEQERRRRLRLTEKQ
ncbi:MAG: tetratricopeptide repeat protein, partial [Bryobacteraceae bacterium]